MAYEKHHRQALTTEHIATVDTEHGALSIHRWIATGQAIVVLEDTEHGLATSASTVTKPTDLRRMAAALTEAADQLEPGP